jgi:DNA-binding NarL/FixJ family response regulator
VDSITRTALPFTRRERQIVIEILQGSTNQEIGRRLGVTERTIKNQLTPIFQKCGVRNRVQLAIFALTHLADREGFVEATHRAREAAVTPAIGVATPIVS